MCVLAVMVVVVFGGYVVAGALSEPAGPPVTVAGIVRVSPLSGWEVAERSAAPPSVRFTRGSGNLDVMVFLFSGTPFDLAAELHLTFDALAVAYRRAMQAHGFAPSP